VDRSTTTKHQNPEIADSGYPSETSDRKSNDSSKGSSKEENGSSAEEVNAAEGSEGAEVDEDLDGYSDVGWGDRKPVTGEDLASLVVDPQDLEVSTHILILVRFYLSVTMNII
jgi:hypothetical protein